MASFQTKIGWKRQKIEKIKIIVPFCSYPTGTENSKKIAKNSKKSTNTIMASFQAKIGWKMQKIEKIRIIIPFCSNPTNKRKLQKNNKNIQKIEKYHHVFFSIQSRPEKAEKERK